MNSRNPFNAVTDAHVLVLHSHTGSCSMAVPAEKVEGRDEGMEYDGVDKPQWT